MKNPQLAFLLAALSLFTASCANMGRGGGAGGAGGGYDELSDATPLPTRDENVSFAGPGSERVNRELFSPVYFKFDSSKLGASELPKIDSVATYMKTEGASATVIIAGFTDAVGTEEYNRQLGEYRALHVRSLLTQRGIAASRIQTVSFGEDLPAVAGSSASAHAANRRAEFGIIR